MKVHERSQSFCQAIQNIWLNKEEDDDLTT